MARQLDGDDGHTVADMSGLDGLGAGAGLPGEPSMAAGGEARPSRKVAEELGDAEDRLMVILGTLRAALSIWVVYVVVFGVVIAFLLWLWR